MRKFLLFFLLISWECEAQEIILTNFKEPEDIPKSIPEQLGLKSLNDSLIVNDKFDSTNFEIRIWKNEPFIPKTHLWQIIKSDNSCFCKNYKYLLGAIYRHNGTIILDKYDSLLWRRLPICGGNGVIGYKLIDLSISNNNEKAKDVYNQILIDKFHELRSFEYNNACMKPDTSEPSSKRTDDLIASVFSPKTYTIEVFSKNFYWTVEFPANLEIYKDCFNNKKILEYGDHIMKLLKKI